MLIISLQWVIKDDDWFPESSTATGEANVGFKAAKNDESGDLDIAMSPAVLNKLKDIFSKIPACGATVKRKLGMRNRPRQSPSCGFDAAADAVAADSELSAAFQQLPQIVADAVGQDYQALVEAGQQIATLTVKQLAEYGIEVEVAAGLHAIGFLAGAGLIVQLLRMSQNAEDIPLVIGNPASSVNTVAMGQGNGDSGSPGEEDGSKVCPVVTDDADRVSLSVSFYMIYLMWIISSHSARMKIARDQMENAQL